jgi:hypothetical protein
LLALALLAAPPLAVAEPVGLVTEVTGTLLSKGATGAIKVLSPNSPLEQGATLVTRNETYARAKLADDTLLTLSPDTQLTIEKYAFDPARPQNNGGVLRLVRGGVRIAAGRLGKRSEESFTLETPSGSIDIRGTTFFVEYVPPAATALRDASPVLLALEDSTVRMDSAVVFDAVDAVPLVRVAQIPAAPPKLAPGLYVQVIDGAINLSTKGGSQNFSAGQFGFTPSLNQPPIILPSNPGLKFTPPPAFSAPPSSSSSSPKAGTVDCVVR